jgi:hypothetical protein
VGPVLYTKVFAFERPSLLTIPDELTQTTRSQHTQPAPLFVTPWVNWTAKFATPGMIGSEPTFLTVLTRSRLNRSAFSRIWGRRACRIGERLISWGGRWSWFCQRACAAATEMIMHYRHSLTGTIVLTGTIACLECRSKRKSERQGLNRVKDAIHDTVLAHRGRCDLHREAEIEEAIGSDE